MIAFKILNLYEDIDFSMLMKYSAFQDSSKAQPVCFKPLVPSWPIIWWNLDWVCNTPKGSPRLCKGAHAYTACCKVQSFWGKVWSECFCKSGCRPSERIGVKSHRKLMKTLLWSRHCNFFVYCLLIWFIESSRGCLKRWVMPTNQLGLPLLETALIILWYLCFACALLHQHHQHNVIQSQQSV